ncbi:hypothetical protein PV11_03690 [Exophiala sideris]|uniref:Uncharacterized protein n=1 Tax=Exophiala sideris TaxID=1016849 RepID=A0A0D1YF49_9EURO|nr:hypothetical protein PV11_03690 [Exophiala sideris]
MAPRTAGAQYAKERREEEAAAAQEAKALVPPKYFDAVETEADGRNNPTTTILKGVNAYLTEIGSGPTVQSLQQPSNSPTGPVAAKTPQWLQSNPNLRALQQAMIRLIQCIQQRALEEGGLADDIQQVIDLTNNALVDVIEEIDRRST